MRGHLRITAMVMIVAALATTSARAQESAPPPSTAPLTPASAAPGSTVPAKPAATTTRAGSTKRTSRTAGTASKPRAAEPSRTLQDIHIEGEIPVPQVLFITARDQRRFMDLQHRRYLRTSQEVGEQTVFPSWIALIRNHPAVERKETPR